MAKRRDMSPVLREYYLRGLQEGRAEVIKELLRLLQLDEYIATAIVKHEEQYHGR